MNVPSLWQTRRFALSLEQPLVMGIVNATPDSFSDGGRPGGTAGAKAHCDRLLAEGAHILDIGGESTRPGAVMPSEAEELDRVLPVVEHAVTLGVPVSVDTSRPAVMSAVLQAGADIVIDVRALTWPGALEAFLRFPDAGLCLMHFKGEPATMQLAPAYDDVVEEVQAWLAERLRLVVNAGVNPGRIVLDPGYGFGKNLTHNLALFQAQPRLLALGRPLLVGWSRKGTLGQLTGRPVGERLIASVSAALAAVTLGARVVRVHDVAATVDALKIWQAAGLAEAHSAVPTSGVTTR